MARVDDRSRGSICRRENPEERAATPAFLALNHVRRRVPRVLPMKTDILLNLIVSFICFAAGVLVGAVGLLTLFAYDAIRLPWLHLIR